MRTFQNLLVTGGAGFIGSNFIRHVLAKTDFEGRIVNFDALTYAGNPESLADVAAAFGDRYVFLHADIRDAAAVHAAERRAKEELGACADRRMAELTDLYAAYTRLEAALSPLERAPGGVPADLRDQLEFLFSPGFLRRPAVWSDYRRYLRAAALRAERINGNPGKDAAKAAPLTEWFERFAAARNAVDDLCDSPGLYAFWQLLEEARIAVFAPELPLRIKTPVHKLNQAWKELRF